MDRFPVPTLGHNPACRVALWVDALTCSETGEDRPAEITVYLRGPELEVHSAEWADTGEAIEPEHPEWPGILELAEEMAADWGEDDRY